MGVNDPFIPVDYMRYMLKYDTVHGRFPNTVEVAGDSIAVGGDKVKVFGERDPSRAVWKSTSELGYCRDDGLEFSRHRADAATEIISRRWRGSPEI